MAGIGVVLAWFGYAVAYYGYNTVTGGNESFMSLVWPGRYTPVARDDGTGGPTGKGAQSIPGKIIKGQPTIPVPLPWGGTIHVPTIVVP